MDKTIINILADMKENLNRFIEYDDKNLIYIYDYNTILCFNKEVHYDLCLNLFKHCVDATNEINHYNYTWIFKDELNNKIKIVIKR